HVLFGIAGGEYGIYDGCIAWLMDDLTIVNRFAGLPGWEDVAERTDEGIEDYGHLAQEAAMRELWALGAELPEREGEAGWRDEVRGRGAGVLPGVSRARRGEAGARRR